MAEVEQESTHVVSSKQRITLFLSAMRHYAQSLQAKQWPVYYTTLNSLGNVGSLAGELEKTILLKKPQNLIMVRPGEWRVLKSLQAVAAKHHINLEIKEDRHFLCTPEAFQKHLAGRKQIRLEFFYREMRQKTGILMNGKIPIGDKWNFDTENRGSFGKQGPKNLPQPSRFEPDSITQEVMQLVNDKFAHHPGSISTFTWPVTREHALIALQEFVAHRLPFFGQYQDAMWEGEVWLFHSHLSCALNTKLLHPQEVIDKAQEAYLQGHAPIEAIEGFIRQILGWREYVRGIYWTYMPEYVDRNAMQATAKLPEFFWTGQTDMACLKDAIGLTLQHGYAHHIQRLMVTGLYALLLGVNPKQVHAWYLGVYVDAVEWVEVPNTIGMSQYADGGLMASKPYIASGKYIDRMSNHCKGCKFNPAESIGDSACPITTLYWDYLNKHADALAKNPRMVMQLKNLHRLTEEKREAIALQVAKHKEVIYESA
jgi:deoxyribodipyrimidine photolyase-related protein